MSPVAEITTIPPDARAELRRMLDCTRGGHVEIVLKDISTVARQPQRLWEWAAMAMELVEGRA